MNTGKQPPKAFAGRLVPWDIDDDSLTDTLVPGRIRQLRLSLRAASDRPTETRQCSWRHPAPRKGGGGFLGWLKNLFNGKKD